MNHKLTKSIQWSYPTSPNSEKFGFEKTGCFTLELTDPAGLIPPQPLKGFATEIEAMKAAKTLPQAWDRLYVKYHPESFNAGCDRCGVNDREPGSRFCLECLKHNDNLARHIPSTSQGDEEERRGFDTSLATTGDADSGL